MVRASAREALDSRGDVALRNCLRAEILSFAFRPRPPCLLKSARASSFMFWKRCTFSARFCHRSRLRCSGWPCLRACDAFGFRLRRPASTGDGGIWLCSSSSSSKTSPAHTCYKPQGDERCHKALCSPRRAKLGHDSARQHQGAGPPRAAPLRSAEPLPTSQEPWRRSSDERRRRMPSAESGIEEEKEQGQRRKPSDTISAALFASCLV